MALEYSLVIAQKIEPVELLACALPGVPVEREGAVWFVDMRQSHGFVINCAGFQPRRGYFEASVDGRGWSWEPEGFINVGFRVDKDFPRELLQVRLWSIVEKFISVTCGDIALIYNGERLLARRESGNFQRLVSI